MVAETQNDVGNGDRNEEIEPTGEKCEEDEPGLGRRRSDGLVLGTSLGLRQAPMKAKAASSGRFH